MPKKLTQEEFIAKAQAVHGATRYDYSRVNYTSSDTPVSILCRIHGPFMQAPNSHTSQRQGCYKCGLVRSSRKQRHGRAEFIARARATHGEHYDYSRVVYKGNKLKVTIICREHGPFEQLPGNHSSSGHNCPQCGWKVVARKITKGAQRFIEKAQSVHGLRYDYSLVSYSHTETPVTIVCPDHGPFEQTPHEHISGCGCRVCGREKQRMTHQRDTALFIADAQTVHGATRYDYSRVNYTSCAAKVEIRCPQHGPFMQTPTMHTRARQGCPECGRETTNAVNRLSWIERAQGRTPTLYFLRLYGHGEEFYKVGITLNSVQRRYASAWDTSGYAYEVMATHTSSNAAAVWEWEQSILQTFAHLRYRPKVSFGGETECFSSANEILTVFPL